MRKNPILFLVAAIILGAGIVLWANIFTRPAAAAWWDDTFGYRQGITITVSSNSSDVSNLETLLTVNTSALISTGKMQTNCADLRFTNVNGTPLKYYIDSGCNTTTTKVWVMADLVPKNTTTYTMYMYYGNPSAKAGTDPATFNLFNGLVGYWTMNEASWNGTSGEVKDSSVNGNNGTSQNSANINSARYGNGGNFNGTDTSVQIADASNLQLGTGDFTVSAWAYPRTIPLALDDQGTIISKNYTGIEYKFYQNKLNASIGSGNSIAGARTITTGAWYFVTLTRSGSTVQSYINSQLDATTTNSTSISNPGTSFNIGQRTGSSNFALDGLVDDVRIYNRALSAQEVQQLYSNPGTIASTQTTVSRPTTAFLAEEKTTRPMLFWRMDEGTGTTLNSSVATFSATLNGAINNPTWQTEDQCVSGKCLYFEGSNATASATTNILGIQSVSFWAKPASSSGTIPLISFSSGTGTTAISSSNLSVTTAGISSPTIYINGKLNQLLQSNQWNHVEVVTSSGFNATNPVLGKIQTTYFKGFLDEVKFYRYARTAAQAKADSDRGATARGSDIVLGAQTNDALNKGLVGYWKMDEATWSGQLNEVLDSSGNGNNGQAACTGTGCGKAYPGAGKFGNGGTFDGVDNAIIMGNNQGSLPGGSFTLSLWVKPNSVTPSFPGAMLANENNGTYTYGIYGLYIYNSNVSAYFYDGSGYKSTSGPISNGVWTHIVGVWDKSSQLLNLYANGVFINSVNGTFTTGGVSFSLGANYYNQSTYQKVLNGSLDDVRIYNRALSPAEVRQLYNFAPGPVGYWKFDEGSGNTVSDSSGNGNAGTWAGASPNHWVNGKYGKAGTFDGATDKVTITNPSIMNNTTGLISVSAWVNPSSVSGNHAIITRQSGSTGWTMWLTSNRVQWRLYTGGTNSGSDLNCSASTLSTNKWSYVTASWDGANSYIFINGVQCTSQAVTGTLATGMNLNLAWDGASTYFSGSLDDVKIYNYARTPDQIMEDMNGRFSPIGGAISSTGKGTVGYWNFDEGQGQTVHDLSGNGNNGTLGANSTPASDDPVWNQSGKFGKALQLKGTSVFADMGNSSSLMPTTSVTMSAWSYTGDNKAVQFIGGIGTTGNQGYWLGEGSGNSYTFSVGNNGSVNTVSATLGSTLNAWHFVTGTWDGTTAKIYVDGQYKAQLAVTAPMTYSSVGNFRIGNINGSGGTDARTWNGLIDEVKIYNYALSADEVKEEYNHGSGMVFGAISDTSKLTGGSVASNSASAKYCVPGDTASCAAPVAEWNFDEGSGTSVADSSGNGNTGTWNGTGPGSSGNHWTNGKFGKGGVFNGVNDYVAASDPLTTQTGWTFEAWANSPVASSNSTQPIIANRQSGNDKGVYLLNGKIYLFYYPQVYNTVGITPIGNNMWFHIVLVRNGSTLNIYVNGKLDQAQTISDAVALNGNIWMGRLNMIGTEYYFNGFIDRGLVFNYARSAAQVAWDYNQGKPVGQWNFDECQGSVLHDAISATNSATLTVGGTVGTCTDGTGTSNWNQGATGKYGASLWFNGSADHADVAAPINNVYAVSFWAKPTTTTQSFLQLSSAVSVAATSGTVAGTGFSSPTIYVDGKVSCVSCVTSGSWHHIVVTSGTSLSASAIKFGLVGSTYYSGQLDDVRIFNYPLTSTQVKLLFNQSSGIRFGPDSGTP